MKPLVIAAATLALAGAAFAQAESQTPPAAVTEQVEGTAAAMGDAAAKAADDAAAAADQAAEAAQKAAAAAETTAADAAEMAEDMGEDAALAADQAAEDAAAAADQAADDAAMAADNAASGAGKAAENAAEDAGAAADEAEKAADAVTEAVPQVTPPDVNPPAISEAEPGVLSSWVTSRRIWTTGQPSATEWVDPMLQERPAEWQDIAKVNDIVLDDSGQVVGYIADIGGFLGIGAKKVLLGTDAIHLLSIGNDTFFVTNYTKQELEALPDFDEKTVRK